MRRALYVALLSCMTLSYGFARHGEVVRAFLRREVDVFGNPVFIAPHGVPPETSARVDFRDVHRRAIPTYVATASRADSLVGRRRAEYAARALQRELVDDPNLGDVWREMHELISLDAARNARRIDYLLWAHNTYLERLGQPFRVEAMLYVGDGGAERARLSIRTYEVIDDARAPTGERVRLVRRTDTSAFREPWLGRTAREEDGAFVLADRVLHFAVRHVWPAMNAALDARRPLVERGPLAGMREEARAHIDPALFAVLEETAEDQAALLEASASIDARHACGSEFRVFDVPYRGLSPRSYAMLAMAIERSRGAPCPDVTLAEAAQIVGASERLAETPRLEEALEALTSLVGRAVAVHELRHVADGPAREFVCPGCEGSLSSMARAELSGYLASFAAEGSAYTAALVACANPERERGDDAAAIRAALEATGVSCSSPLPSDLVARAEDAERRIFGAREAVRIDPTFPRPVEFIPRRRAVVPRDWSWLVESP